MRIPTLLFTLLLLSSGVTASAQEPTAAEELLAMERLREQVEAAFRLCTDPPPERHDQRSGCRETVRRLVAMGPEIVPFVENELDQETPYLDFVALNVLGLIPSEQTAGTLKEAVQRFDRAEPSQRTRNLKIWALLGLALQGDTTVVNLANSGVQHVGMDQNLYLRTPLLAVLAVLTAPDSHPLLMKQVELYGEGDRYLDQLLAATAALAQVAEPEAFQPLSRLASHEEWPIRMASLDGFRRLGDQRSVDRLMAVLDSDPDRRVRLGAAMALARMKPAGGYPRFVAILEKEPFYPIRGILYKLVAQLGGAEAVPDLLRYRGSQDPGDRRVLVTGLSWTGSSRALAAIRQGLVDPDNTVVFAALDALDRLGSPAAVDSLLAAVGHANSGVATTATRLLVRRDETRAGARIASRLVGGILAADADPLQRDPVRLLSQGLVELRYTKARPELARALERQTDIDIRRTLLDTITLLQMIERGGDRVEYWAGLLEHESHPIRSNAVASLGRIGSRKAVKLLIDHFDQADLEDQVDIVRRLHRADPDQVEGFLRGIFHDPRFDPPWYAPLRATAAWTAARIGGKSMADLILKASEEVGGTNRFYLLYLMKVDPERGLAHLEATRLTRLRSPDSWRWHETSVLEEVADDLRAGFRHPLLDTPPEEVEIQHR